MAAMLTSKSTHYNHNHNHNHSSVDSCLKQMLTMCTVSLFTVSKPGSKASLGWFIHFHSRAGDNEMRREEMMVGIRS